MATRGRASTEVKIAHSHTFDSAARVLNMVTNMPKAVHKAPHMTEALEHLEDQLRLLHSYEPTSQDLVDAFYRLPSETQVEELAAADQQRTGAVEVAELTPEAKSFRCLKLVSDAINAAQPDIKELKEYPQFLPSGGCCSKPSQYPQLLTIRKHTAAVGDAVAALGEVCEAFKQAHWSQTLPYLAHTVKAMAKPRVHYD